MPRPHRLRAAAIAALVLLASAGASAQGVGRAADVLRAAPGQAVAAAAGSPAATVARALGARGADAATQQSLVVQSSGAGRAGLTHARIGQQVGGLAVYGASAKATFDAAGNLVHLVDQTARIGSAAPAAARIDARAALAAAMAAVHPTVIATFRPAGGSGATARFDGGPFFHNAAEVTRVLAPQASGGLAEAFLVQTWTQRANQLDHVLVSGDGAVLNVERRTANDRYNVFAIDPGKGPQTVVNGPGTAGNAESPAGWLTGLTHRSIAISGNNVSAYLDADANNAADAGGTTVNTGDFLAAANLAAAPTTTTNRDVAVQNLFYLNNVIHDILYRHGFTEAAGNFQLNNFGKGGAGNDPVNAEAQDGGGTDNANFSTPTDGTRPRMQMYLWSPTAPTHEVMVGGASYGAYAAQFGPALTTTGIAGALALATSSGGATDGCSAITSAVSGRIAIVDRGTCNFDLKVKNAQAAGAVGVVVANNVAGAPFSMGGTTKVRIPSVMVSQADGVALKSLAGSSGTMRKKGVQPPQLDGDLDSDIVYHEYGHGLSWRMIGGMSGPLAGAIGEGASDVVSFMVNGDDIVGEYAFGNPAGIRRHPYGSHPLTYSKVAGAAVHDDGEIYAAAMWRLRDLWLAEGRSNDDLFGVFVDGMNFTPATPAFEHMRDGMLQSIASSGAADADAQCALVWQAFAERGIGLGASGKVSRRGTVTIVESFDAKSTCN